jgi:hypothetical protein
MCGAWAASILLPTLRVGGQGTGGRMLSTVSQAEGTGVVA